MLILKKRRLRERSYCVFSYSVGGYKEDGVRIVRDAQQKDKRQEPHFIKASSD